MRGNDKDGWLSMPIEEFWHAMESPKVTEKNFQLLRKRIIEPAVKELTEKDGWLIEWEAVKSGRRVASCGSDSSETRKAGCSVKTLRHFPNRRRRHLQKIICGKIRYEREGEAERLRRPSVVAVTANPPAPQAFSSAQGDGFLNLTTEYLSWL